MSEPTHATIRTTGTRVRWQEVSGWKPWMDCYSASIENDCLRIVTKNTFTLRYYEDEPESLRDCDERDDEVTLVPLHVIRGRIEIRRGTGEAL